VAVDEVDGDGGDLPDEAGESRRNERRVSNDPEDNCQTGPGVEINELIKTYIGLGNDQSLKYSSSHSNKFFLKQHHPNCHIELLETTS
jgi:hypothetical protein